MTPHLHHGAKSALRTAATTLMVNLEAPHMRIPRGSKLLPVFPFAIAALALAWASSTAGNADERGSNAHERSERGSSKQPAPLAFTVAQLFLELNNTDGDLGIHASINSDQPWTQLEMEGPTGQTLLNLTNSSTLHRQGLTQLSLESAEPPFTELAPADFFRRFREGRYEIEGVTLGGAQIESTAVLSHVLAAPPKNLSFSGVAAPESCSVTPLPIVTPPVLVGWDAVTESHPEIGRTGPVEVSQYQLFVQEQAVDHPVSLGVDLPPSVTQFTIPTGITSLGQTFKFEIIIRTTAGNNTAVETCFEVLQAP
jgi:hypothetical protein